MLWDLINWQKLKRALLYAIYMALVLLVQDALFSHISILGREGHARAGRRRGSGHVRGRRSGGRCSPWRWASLADMSYGNTALFVALFPCIGFVSGALSRWLVNRRFFAYLCMALFFLALTALFQMAELLLMGQNAAELAWGGAVADAVLAALRRRAVFPLQVHSRGA